MKGYVFVSGEGTNTQKELSYWIDLALAYNDKAKASKNKQKKVV